MLKSGGHSERMVAIAYAVRCHTNSIQNISESVRYNIDEGSSHGLRFGRESRNSCRDKAKYDKYRR